MMLNRFEISADGAYYKIFLKHGGIVFVDYDDFPKVSSYTWSLGKRGYPTANIRKFDGSKSTTTMHKLLFGYFEKGIDVDHISGNKLDNRRSNLRLCSHQQNMFNQKKRSTNTSGYTGVSYRKKDKKFEAYIHHNGRKKGLGLFLSAKEAAIARDKASIELFGEYGRLNFPMEHAL